MRIGLIALAASTIIAAAIPSVSASAEELGVHVGGGGVGVHVGDEHRDRGDHWRQSQRVGHEGCRTITVKHRTPDGGVVIKKTRQCD